MQLGDQRRAEISLHKALSLESNTPDTHLLLGYLKLRQDKLPEALVEFRKANELDQTDTVSLCMIGYVFEKSGKTDRAMKYYAQALKMRPNDELATRLMATIDANERE
jgi:Tfp pilus assembly protein PilF